MIDALIKKWTLLWWKKVARSRAATLFMLQHIAEIEPWGIRQLLPNHVIETAPSDIRGQLEAYVADELSHGAIALDCIRSFGVEPRLAPINPLFKVSTENKLHFNPLMHALCTAFVAEESGFPHIEAFAKALPEGFTKSAFSKIVTDERRHVTFLREYLIHTFPDKKERESVVKYYQRAVMRSNGRIFLFLNTQLARLVPGPFFVVTLLFAKMAALLV